MSLSIRDLWVDLGGVEVLRGVDLELAAGERVALMGRNGAGKTTLLRTAAGLLDPVRGRVEAPSGVALVPQSPGDVLVRERVSEELGSAAGAEALAAVGLELDRDPDPRDLSGGERQRLALAIVLAGRLNGSGGAQPAVAMDEPTRGMDRARKGDLGRLIADLAERGSAVVVATHDVEFAATFAERVILLGAGEVVADASAREVLSGGWYFATEVARVLGADGVITPAQGAEALGAPGTA